MVRVISVHHFTAQHIQTVEQPTATTIAPPDRLLLALSSHCIEVRDLHSDADLLFSFPTVDEVKELVHCLNGDYIAALERKRSRNRQNHDTYYARIYANWDSVATMQQSKMTHGGVSLGVSECGMVQPMRARIAGRVTPTTNQQSEVSSLEMIELPVKRRPDMINCCQVSGNVIVLSAKYLMVYKFCVRTHDISKLQFIDFEELSLLLELRFQPTSVQLCENYIACMNESNVHLFTVVQLNETLVETKKKDYTYFPNTATITTNSTTTCDGPLSYKSLLAEEETFNCNLITVNLPSILKENSAIHKHCPFTCCDTDMTVNIKSISPIENNWTESYQVNNLLQLKLKPMVIEGAHRQITEEFKCLVLKPLYVTTTKSKRLEKKPLLKSEFGYSLNSVACLLTTQQEAYLYIFCDNCSEQVSQVDNCIAVYPFTAPVFKVVLEDYLLHALTETGLESYTLRIGHQLAHNVHKVNNINVACPSVKDSVCLVGLRPFIGVEQLLISDHYLVLLANSDNSPTHSVSSTGSSSSTNWTLYNLGLPSALTLYNDFLSFANIHQFSSPQTYGHLISEAHMVLKVSLMLLQWRHQCESAVDVIAPWKNDDENLSEAYKTSCCLLGDYYVMCDEPVNYTLSLPYYKMSQISPLEVLKRVQNVQQQSNCKNMTGLLYYLKTVLLQIKTWTEADILFTLLGEQNFVDTILDLFSKHDKKNLSTLVLKNNVLREYATDKLINIFLDNKLKEHNDFVALAVLCLQRYKQQEAKHILELIPTESLHDILVQNWELLFDTTTTKTNKDYCETTFSELTAILIGARPLMLAELLAYLVTDLRAVSLEKLLKVFLEFLPSHISKEGTTGSLVLQILLENYFKNYFSLPENVYRKTNYDTPSFEALKILVRTYLSQLQLWQLNVKDTRQFAPVDQDETSQLGDFLADLPTRVDQPIRAQATDDYLFSKIRWSYLDQMPPFTDSEKRTGVKRNRDTDVVLKKLQALLCSQLIPKQVINEMMNFFKMNVDFKGNVSLQSIVLPIKDGTAYLVEKCPDCVLQYGKDRFTKDEEWTVLITTIQNKILLLDSLEQTSSLDTFNVILLKDVMLHLATTVPIQRFLQLLPNKQSPSGDVTTLDKSLITVNDINLFDIDNYEPYIVICKQTAHANHIKRLIVATGQKLLTTLNL